MILKYPRPPVIAIWPIGLPGMTVSEGIDLSTWLKDYGPTGDTLATVPTVVSVPSDLTVSATLVGNVVMVRRSGGTDGTVYAVVVSVTSASGLAATFTTLLPVRATGSGNATISGAAALALILAGLPTTKPTMPNQPWNNSGVIALS